MHVQVQNTNYRVQRGCRAHKISSPIIFLFFYALAKRTRNPIFYFVRYEILWRGASVRPSSR